MMMPSNTICVSPEGPANALALNKDCSQVVIAGRNVFKVFAIGENDFTEVCNLRVGKNLNLNFSSIDVAWSSIEENTLATAATNGAVVVWNLGRSGRSKQEHVFSDHKRTVNKVSFHLTEPSLLISGSQDGTMKCFDLRMKEVARTFVSNTESIRDVQFSPHQAHAFAAVSENGNVQVWDVRRHERCVLQFTSHSGPVFACDWHPELPWLATASRDKTIKVWDLHAKPSLEHTIYTIASVGHVKWRPQKKYQVASCALVLDCAVHVWDVRRPHVPLATFAEQRDVTTAVGWLRGAGHEPTAFLSTSRDCGLYRHTWRSAAHPVLWSPAVGTALSPRGDLLYARPLRALPRPTDLQPGPTATKAIGRKQPTAGSLSWSAQLSLERAFPLCAASGVVRHRVRGGGGGGGTSAVLACAVRYRVRGAAPHELAAHNARVARDCDRHMVSHLWLVIQLVYSTRAAPPHAQPPPLPPRPRPRRPAPPPDPPALHVDVNPPPHYSLLAGSVTEEEAAEEAEQWPETTFHMSGVLGKPTHSIYIPPARCRRNNHGWVSAASLHYVDLEGADWTLPEEAFPLRAAAAPSAGTQYMAHEGGGAQLGVGGGVGVGGTGAASSVQPSSPSGSSASSGGDGPPPRGGGGSAPEEESSSVWVSPLGGGRGGGGGGGGAWGGAGGGALPTGALLSRALKLHADHGDVQTACVAMLLLQEHRSDLFPYIDEGLQEQWLLGYIELLQRHKLWNVATEVIRCAWLGSVWGISQQSTGVALCCARCGRRTRPRAQCERCAPRHKPDLCAVCHQVVRGLYAWCQGCAHGGHLHHMRQWVGQHQLCPAGCGHHCQLG